MAGPHARPARRADHVRSEGRVVGRRAAARPRAARRPARRLAGRASSQVPRARSRRSAPRPPRCSRRYCDRLGLARAGRVLARRARTAARPSPTPCSRSGSTRRAHRRRDRPAAGHRGRRGARAGDAGPRRLVDHAAEAEPDDERVPDRVGAAPARHRLGVLLDGGAHAGERDMGAWATEWIALPQACILASSVADKLAWVARRASWSTRRACGEPRAHTRWRSSPRS